MLAKGTAPPALRSKRIFHPIDLATLPEVRRRRALWILLGAIFLIQSGFFLVVPLISVHFVDGLGWAAAFIGLVLALRQFLQQTLTFLGGALADRLGPKGLILIGIAIRALSFVLIGLATTPALLLGAGVLAAIGGAFFDAPLRAMVAMLAPPERFTYYFTRLGMLKNLAQMVGPAVGALLIRHSFLMVGLGSTAFLLATLLVVMVGVPAVAPPAERAEARPLGQTVRSLLRDRPFVLLTILMMGFWFLWVQLSIALPLVIKGITQDDSQVGAFLAFISVTGLLLQLPAVWLAARFLRPLQVVVVGTAVAALGLGGVAFVSSIWQLHFSLIVFMLGVVLVTPNVQTVAATLAKPTALGSYLGFHALAMAVGGGLGHLMGGLLIDLAAAWHMPALPWLTFAGLGLLTAVGLYRFAQQTTQQRYKSTMPLGRETFAN